VKELILIAKAVSLVKSYRYRLLNALQFFSYM